MTHVSKILALAVVSLAATGCATREVAKLEAHTTLAAAPNILPAAALSNGQASMAWGDRWTAANLFERSVEAKRTLLGHFNLAAAYERTGRFEEAAANYRVVAQHGQYRWGTSVRENDNQKVNVRRFNLADEAARRLARMDRPVVYGALANGGAFAATDVGVQASAIVGGDASKISDDQAIQRDAAAEAARGL